MIQQKLFNFKIESTDEKLTSKAGLIFIAEYIKSLNIKELIDKHIPKPMSNRAYKPSTFVITILLLIIAGGKSLDDIRELESEKALFDLLGIDTIPDPTSVGDFLRRNSKYLDNFGTILDKFSSMLFLSDDIQKYTLDMDATEVVANKEDAKYTYKKENKGYMPMLGTFAENKFCVKDEFREGNVSPAYAHKEFYTEIKNILPKNKKVGYLRADSASYNFQLFNELEKDKVYFAITARHDAAVWKAIKSIKNWTKPEGQDFEVAETIHSMGKSKKAFRLVVKREFRKRQAELFKDNKPKEKYYYHAVATNIPEEEMDALSVLKFHNQRGESENINKEVKIGFGLEKMPCGDFNANALFFRLGIFAYNIFIAFKRNIMPSMLKQTISTFRWKIIDIAGKIITHAGKNILKISPEKLELFHNIKDKIVSHGFAVYTT